MQIITNEPALRQKSTSATPEEAQEILSKLREVLITIPAYGLSAPQIGIFKSVGIVSVKEYGEISLVNPIIIKQYDSIINRGEGCLSFPGVRLDTHRFQYIVIKDDLHPEGIVCENMEAFAVQHEIDHLQGILFMDRQVKKPIQIQNPPKIGRNDPCPECLKEDKSIKFKKCLLHYVK